MYFSLAFPKAPPPLLSQSYHSGIPWFEMSNCAIMNMYFPHCSYMSVLFAKFFFFYLFIYFIIIIFGSQEFFPCCMPYKRAGEDRRVPFSGFLYISSGREQFPTFFYNLFRQKTFYLLDYKVVEISIN